MIIQPSGFTYQSRYIFFQPLTWKWTWFLRTYNHISWGPSTISLEDFQPYLLRTFNPMHKASLNQGITYCATLIHTYTSILKPRNHIPCYSHSHVHILACWPSCQLVSWLDLVALAKHLKVCRSFYREDQSYLETMPPHLILPLIPAYWSIYYP